MSKPKEEAKAPANVEDSDDSDDSQKAKKKKVTIVENKGPEIPK